MLGASKFFCMRFAFLSRSVLDSKFPAKVSDMFWIALTHAREKRFHARTGRVARKHSRLHGSTTMRARKPMPRNNRSHVLRGKTPKL
jgi:hypothetical protein